MLKWSLQGIWRSIRPHTAKQPESEDYDHNVDTNLVGRTPIRFSIGKKEMAAHVTKPPVWYPSVSELISSSVDKCALSKNLEAYDALPLSATSVHKALSATTVAVYPKGEMSTPADVTTHHSTLFMYSDASTRDDYPPGPSGLGIAWKRGPEENWKHRMIGVSGIASVNFAELVAVYEATDLALSLCQEQQAVWSSQTITHVFVYTDSQNALHSIHPSIRGCKSYEMRLLALIMERVQKLQNMGIYVAFSWVKGHHITKGNNYADRVAAAARRNALINPPPASQKVVPPISIERLHRATVQLNTKKKPKLGAGRTNNELTESLIGLTKRERIALKTQANLEAKRNDLIASQTATSQKAEEKLAKLVNQRNSAANIGRPRTYIVNTTAIRNSADQAFDSYLRSMQEKKEYIPTNNMEIKRSFVRA